MSLRRYVIARKRPLVSSDDEPEFDLSDIDIPFLPQLTVYDDEPEYTDTGLVSEDGEPILVSNRGPLGFLSGAS